MSNPPSQIWKCCRRRMNKMKWIRESAENKTKMQSLRKCRVVYLKPKLRRILDQSSNQRWTSWRLKNQTQRNHVTCHKYWKKRVKRVHPDKQRKRKKRRRLDASVSYDSCYFYLPLFFSMSNLLKSAEGVEKTCSRLSKSPQKMILLIIIFSNTKKVG